MGTQGKPDLKALAEEFAALLGDEQTFIEIYRRATAEKFGFLYITMGSDLATKVSSD